MPKKIEQEQKHSPSFTGLDLLKILGGFAGGAALAKLLPSQEVLPSDIYLTEPTPQKPEPEFTPIYTSGETIPNPVTPIRIDGWRLVFGIPAMRQHVNKNPSAHINFTVFNGDGSQSSIRPDGGSHFFNLDSQGAVTYNFDEAVERVITAAPLGDGRAFIVFEQKELNGPVVHREIYAIKPRSFEYSEKYVKDGLEVDGLPIISEVALPDKAIAQLQQLSQAFADYALGVKVYIYRGVEDKLFGENRFGSYSLDNNVVRMSGFPFTRERFTNEGDLQLFHELCHAVFADMINSSFDYRGIIRFLQSRIDLVRGAGFEYPNDFVGFMGADPAAEKNPVFRIFDESHYIPVAKTPYEEYGHPYENETELFASTASVLRFYPHAFINRFKELTDAHKSLVREVVDSLLDTLLRNRSEEALQVLLPQVNDVRSALMLQP